MNRDEEIRAFMAEHRSGTSVEPLAADASFRRYLRTTSEPTEVLMDAPPGKEDVRPFMAIGQFLLEQGLSAPQLQAADIENGFLLLEDLGDDTFTSLLESGDSGKESPGEDELYRYALDVLIHLHGRNVPPQLPVEGDATYALPAFDDALMMQEVNLFPDWYLREGLSRPPSSAAQQEWDAIWAELFPLMRVGDDTLVLRDYHADNLMWLPQRDGIARVGLLDFQDGVLGPPAYDLVSLLQDCRRVVPQSLEMTLLDEYITLSPDLDRDDFTRAYALLGVQRNIKIIGIFTRLWRRDGKPFYPSLIPRVWELVERGLNWPGLEEIAALSALREWLHAQAEPALRQQMLPGLPSARRGEHA